MFGIDGAEFLVILAVATILVGPTRLPAYARTLARWTKQAQRLLAQAKSTLRDEAGDTIDVDALSSLDPRRYDPRAIVRDVLATPDEPAESTSTPNPHD